MKQERMVFLPVMPIGVEHEFNIHPASFIYWVFLPVMPIGVDHVTFVGKTPTFLSCSYL